MQDPKERDRWWNEHMEKTELTRKRWLAAIDQPMKPFGFWNSDSTNAKYRTNLDPGVNSLPGRAKTLDD
ncbi:hypothetical protein CVIRNUC_004099 [Coccomyxa viridis]|uniref:Uncharacterized protein n=1 Tax=Coccomyxa viridis TaxID=1274662 RepID=A0AAV1I1J1_9CHLO|nr:hypothetical protein CVIRNUC_004099 [Coccomyxa viridis]